MSTEKNKVRYPPGQGFAWRGDWRKRLSDRLAELGFASLCEFAKSMPGASAPEMVSTLGPGDFATIQIERELLRESEALGDIRSCAKDLAFRRLRAICGGWREGLSRDDQEKVGDTLIGWYSLLPASCQPLGWNVMTGILENDPESIDEEHVEACFLKWWPEEK